MNPPPAAGPGAPCCSGLRPGGAGHGTSSSAGGPETDAGLAETQTSEGKFLSKENILNLTISGVLTNYATDPW